MSEKTTAPSQLQPVAVTVIGTSNVAGGPTPMETGTVATTPAQNQPNLLVNVISPFVAILVRFVYTFGGQLVGLLTAAMTPLGSKLLYTGDFLALLGTCASLSLPWAVLALIKDVVTVFGRLEGKYPLLTGNV